MATGITMTKAVYYVAMATSFDFITPVLVEKFDSEADANTYAALMCRTRRRKYIVLKQVTEWDGITQEK